MYKYDNSDTIEIEMPDFTFCTFIRQNKYLYINETYGYKLSVIYDENDENILEFIVNSSNINYHYDCTKEGNCLYGMLVKISNSYGDLFSFDYEGEQNAVTVTDQA